MHLLKLAEKMKRIIIVSVFSFIVLLLNAQGQENNYAQVDQKILQLSGTTHSSEEIAAYIGKHFSNQTDQLRAAYTWISENIRYDVDNMFNPTYYSDKKELVEYVLKNKKGVCTHYAELFCDIATQLNIKCYVISGYTQQGGVIDPVPHSWSAAFIDSVWCLFDPTWGSGHLNGNKFIKKRNDHYFIVDAEQLIKSHIPFDPLWQFLYYPITHQEFAEGKTEQDKTKPLFNFVDTLKKYDEDSRMQQLLSANRRIEESAVNHPHISRGLEQNNNEIEYLKNQIFIVAFNQVTQAFNAGVSQLNSFVDYRNKQFIPQKEEAEIREMVAVAMRLFTDAKNQLTQIQTANPDYINSKEQLLTSIEGAIQAAENQNIFLDSYFGKK